MIRVRFHANASDWRAVKWPPPGPCWCTGYGDDHSTVVAYVDREEQVTEFWPEATSVDIHERDVEPRFSDRFPRPEWWPHACVVPNVRDGRTGRVGSWRTALLTYDRLTEADVGRTVIYRDFGRAEAGTLVSWKDGTVFARFSRGDTAAGSRAENLSFGVQEL